MVRPGCSTDGEEAPSRWRICACDKAILEACRRRLWSSHGEVSSQGEPRRTVHGKDSARKHDLPVILDEDGTSV
jgi:hypothetical protein